MKNITLLSCLFSFLSIGINAQNPSIVKHINPNVGVGANVGAFYKTSNDKLFFNANDGVNGAELWQSDGTEIGTFMVKDIDPILGRGGRPSNFLEFNNGITCFNAKGDDNTGHELWRTDGTSNGTVLVKDINPGMSSTYLKNMTLLNDSIFFIADIGGTGPARLWKTDGTVNGTSEINTDYRTPAQLVEHNGTIFYGSSSSWLYKLDGNGGDILVKSFSSSLAFFEPEFTSTGNTLFFEVKGSSSEGFELWKTDGTTAGTVLVKDIRPGVDDSYPSNLTNVNGTLFFTANNGTNGTELWKSDGTAAGTVLVKDINPMNNDGSNPSMFTNLNGTLFFTANDGTNGRQVWKSDGTATGTVIVKNITYSSSFGSFSIFPNNFVIGGNKVYFTIAKKGLYGTDGTVAGTQLLIPDSIVEINNVLVYNSFQSPANIVYMDGKLYFSGSNAFSTGTDLWVYDPTSPTVNINKVKEQEAFVRLYPNPNSGLLTVELDKPQDVAIFILDMMGNTVLQKTIQGTTQLDTETLVSGTYILKLVAKDQTQIIQFVQE